MRDAGEAPRITRIEPAKVEQGQQVEVEIHASRAFGTPVEVTAANVADTVVADGFYTVDQICTAQYAKACAAANIQ